MGPAATERFDAMDAKNEYSEAYFSTASRCRPPRRRPSCCSTADPRRARPAGRARRALRVGLRRAARRRGAPQGLRAAAGRARLGMTLTSAPASWCPSSPRPRCSCTTRRRATSRCRDEGANTSPYSCIDGLRFGMPIRDLARQARVRGRLLARAFLLVWESAPRLDRREPGAGRRAGAAAAGVALPDETAGGRAGGGVRRLRVRGGRRARRCCSSCRSPPALRCSKSCRARSPSTSPRPRPRPSSTISPTSSTPGPPRST